MACTISTLLVPRVNAAKLKPETAAGFEHYIRLTERRMEDDLRNGRFLITDALPDGAQQQIYKQLRQGQIYIVELHTKEDGKPLQAFGGLIHHWAGLAFIPGGTLSETLAVLQNYDSHKEIYKPDVRKSKLLEHQGNEFRVYLQLYRKSLVAVVLNVDLIVRYTFLGNTRAMSRSYSTRIAEVENAGRSNEYELPVEDDHGYLWRLDSYWRVEEKDGGVYVQVESVGLSRTVPWALAWLINPLIRSIPKAVLSRLLHETRLAVANAAPAAAPTGLY